MEDRTLLSTFYVDNAGDYVITNDQGAGGLDDGDTVTWDTGATHPSGPVTNLIFGIDAFASIQDAVNAATKSADLTDTIYIAAGMFLENVTINATGNTQLDLVGTTGAIVDANASGTVINISAGETVNINSLTIQNGNASGAGVSGGIVNSGTLTLTNSVVQNNTTDQLGGGIQQQSNAAVLTVDNTIIQNNVATRQGGGIDGFGSTVFVQNGSKITGNATTSTTGEGFGGGIAINNNGTLLVDNSTISGNTSILGGGGIDVAQGATATIQNGSMISGNSAGTHGGGIHNEGSTVSVSNSSVTGNTAKVDGGGIFNSAGGQFTLGDSALMNNTATNGTGGGIQNNATFVLTGTATTLDTNSPDTISGSGAIMSSPTGSVTFGMGTLSKYSGQTTLTSGTTIVNGTLDNSGGPVTVQSGATLGGTGVVDRAIIVESGGTVAPGLSPGVLNTGSISFSAGAQFSVEINGKAVGTEYDQLNVTGAVDLGSATLAVNLGYMPTFGDSFTIINNDGSDAVTGTFAGIAEGDTVNISGSKFIVSYLGGDGNDVVLTARKNMLMVDIDKTSISENGGTATGTVMRNGTTGDLVVNIVSNDTTEAAVPTMVTILDGKNTAVFTITAVDEMFVDGTQTAKITASAAGFTDGVQSLDITDDDTNAPNDNILLFDETSRTFKLGTNTGTAFTWFESSALPVSMTGYDSFIGDFDGDGDFDGAVRNRDNGIPTLFTNDGKGALSAPVSSLAIATTGTASHFQVGDYDGNGRDEILWQYTSGKYAGTIFSKDFTTGTFYLYKANPNYGALLTGDFNGDGFDDIVGLIDSTNMARTNIIPFFSIASNNANLPRRLSAIPTTSGGPALGSFGQSIATDGLGGFQVADVNNDGCDDIIAVTSMGTTPGQVLVATTTGSAVSAGSVIQNAHRFVASNRAPIFPPTQFAGPVLLGQFDDNPLADLFAANNTGSLNVSSVSLNPMLLNPAVFAAPAQWGTATAGLQYAVGDFNGDRYDDIVGLNGNATVSLSQGSGNSFGMPLDFGPIIGGGAGQIGAIKTG